jgi:hypothetical protein
LQVIAASFVAAALLLPCLADARIPRDPAQVRAFRNENPCPATGERRGACPGWEVDHVTPLCAGGEDRPSNMQWISKEDHRFKTLIDVRECRKVKQHGSH